MNKAKDFFSWCITKLINLSYLCMEFGDIDYYSYITFNKSSLIYGADWF